MSEYTRGTPYMDQAPAAKHHLDSLVLKGADTVIDAITVQGSPSFPSALRVLYRRTKWHLCQL